MPSKRSRQGDNSMARHGMRPKAQGHLDRDNSEDIAAHGSEPNSDLDERNEESSTDGSLNDPGATASDESDSDTGLQLKSVSFGTLVRAQESLARKRKRDSQAQAPEAQEAKLGDLRTRLHDMKRAKLEDTISNSRDKMEKRDKHSKPDSASDDSDTSSDDGRHRSRSSKHAPASQSSRYQVSRKYEVVDVPKRHTRDPRFGPVMSGTSSAPKAHASKAYEFLHSYADSEMRDLRQAIKKTQSEEERGVLRRKLMSMENQRRTRVDKELASQVEREHRLKEKEAVSQGKKPFYLKKSERDRLVQVRRFEGLSEGQREKVIEKRRRKESQKEKKKMPASRRIGG